MQAHDEILFIISKVHKKSNKKMKKEKTKRDMWNQDVSAKLKFLGGLIFVAFSEQK
jgi:hypothetical protein